MSFFKNRYSLKSHATKGSPNLPCLSGQLRFHWAYEPELKGRDKGMPEPIEEHTQIFAILQQYNRLNLLVPVGVKNMWNAAMESKSCRLTALGEHYRRLVEKNRI